ncbi:peptidoglycan-binding domain-containing protein [Streptomyces longispororuber]|uniref:peptidoglycan-binding domain-containing protein n=1 Tax=Streptomyces longispororuber TaxID=68230 RepID=UPI002108B8A8|nr:peptidoglycan-binding domain-containing protein [Streptomyces longispororuber]MCQ4209195.1 peptidoglycan-binding protein [Streptomyces longispororuber]
MTRTIATTPRRLLGVGLASLTLLGGAAAGVATADTAAPAAARGTVHAAADKVCTYYNGVGFRCGYYNGSATIGSGNNGRAVKEVQALLNQTTSAPGTLKVDGRFGSRTKAAVLWFQKKYHVKPYDGIVGPKTWKELRLK